MNAIEVENLSKTFSSRRFKKQVAVNKLSLSIDQGEIFGFLGPNGAGKSTTIKSIIGLITPTAGRIAICGIPSTEPAARKNVGYLPENPSFYEYLSATEYLSFVGKVFGMESKKIATETERILAQLDLTDAADRPLRSYSKGMVQRVGIAQALLHDPDVYIFDEPMSGLDPVGRALVKDIILELKKRRKSVFFSTHITSDVEMICDRVGIIRRGELQMVESVEEILIRGITGYSIMITQDGGSVHRELFVGAAELPKTLFDLELSGSEIIMVEPVRKSLEDLFLEIVKGGNPCRK